MVRSTSYYGVYDKDRQACGMMESVLFVLVPRSEDERKPRLSDERDAAGFGGRSP